MILAFDSERRVRAVDGETHDVPASRNAQDLPKSFEVRVVGSHAASHVVVLNAGYKGEGHVTKPMHANPVMPDVRVSADTPTGIWEYDEGHRRVKVFAIVDGDSAELNGLVPAKRRHDAARVRRHLRAHSLTPVVAPANELMPPSLRKASGSVFHYTSAAGLLGIVQSGCLWASEASSLNDLAEVRRGWEVVRGWLEPRRTASEGADLLADLAQDPLQEKHEVFVLSGSTAADDANQWRLYAQNGRGYAVELSPNVQLAAVSRTPEAKPPKAGSKNIFGWYLGEVVAVTPWYHVLYERTAAIKALRELERATLKGLRRVAREAKSHDHYSELKDELRGSAYEALGAIAHLIKEPGFSGEREVRVVTTYLFANQHIQYRAGDHGVVSYGLLTRAPRGHSTSRILHRPKMDSSSRPGRPLPLRSVRLGPLLAEEHTSTVTRLLVKNDLHSAEVRRSAVRLR